MKTTRPKWMESLDESEIQEAMEEGLVDAYDDHEARAGLLTVAGDSLVFPFQASVLGETVEVVGVDDVNTFGLDLVVVHKGKRYAIAAQSVELLKPLPEGHMHLAAYLSGRQSF